MQFLEWLSLTPVAEALTGSATSYIFVSAAHILSIGLLVGAILPLDLRMLGFFRGVPLDVIGPFLSRAAVLGAGMTIVTGILLFTVRPIEYAGNPAFLTKLGMLSVGLVNAMLLHSNRSWRLSLSTGSAPISVRLSALISLTTWTAAVVAGRWIGFL